MSIVAGILLIALIAALFWATTSTVTITKLNNTLEEARIRNFGLEEARDVSQSVGNKETAEVVLNVLARLGYKNKVGPDVTNDNRRLTGFRNIYKDLITKSEKEIEHHKRMIEEKRDSISRLDNTQQENEKLAELFRAEG